MYEQCGYVELSPKLAHICKPYPISTRGSFGLNELKPNEAKNAFIKRSLQKYQNLQLKSNDDIFVCIPHMQYEYLIYLIETIDY